MQCSITDFAFQMVVEIYHCGFLCATFMFVDLSVHRNHRSNVILLCGVLPGEDLSGFATCCMWTLCAVVDQRSNVILLDLLPGEDLSFGLPLIVRGLQCFVYDRGAM